MNFDLDILKDYYERGLLRRQETEDLVQYNYSEEVNNAPNGELWDEITMFNRGNIYEKKTGKLIAKAMPKFMNLGQYTQEQQDKFLSNNSFTITEKMDGCLGILYKYKGKIMCNSRGGFDNYVTDKIKELLPKYKMLNTLLTYQCMNVEVISPQTKIICDYGNEENLYLITGYLNIDWSEYTEDNLNMISKVTYMPRVKEYKMTWEDLLKWQKTSTWETEGFVVKFPNGDRIKIKSEDYLRVAKIKSKLNKHHIWKLMKNGYKQKADFLSEYINNVPDELRDLADTYLNEINEDMNKLKQEAYELYEPLKDLDFRELSEYIKEHPHKLNDTLFPQKRGYDFSNCIINMVEPEIGFNAGGLNG